MIEDKYIILKEASSKDELRPFIEDYFKKTIYFRRSFYSEYKIWFGAGKSIKGYLVKQMYYSFLFLKERSNENQI